MKFGHIIVLIVILTLITESNNSVLAQKTTSEIESKIDSLIKKMTMAEKVGLCHGQSKFNIKGVPRLGIPELWMSDGPMGVRAEMLWNSWDYSNCTNDSCTAFPALICLASSFDPDLANQFGIAIGEEARFRKKDVLLAPGVNIYRTPLNGRNFEYMGEDPFLSSRMVVPYIKGVQQNGVSACVKHFALNNQERWRDSINVEVSARALNEIYLPAFKAAVVEGGVWAVMGAFNKFQNQFCCQNDMLLNKILKEEWGFDGVVISDWSGTHDTRAAAMNGLDIEMGTELPENYLGTPFLNMINSGEITQKILDDKVKRILRLILRTSMNRNKPWGKMCSTEHSDVARKIAESGIVLLKNQDNILPLSKNTKLKIAVIGENATMNLTDGGGSSMLKAKYEISPLEGIKKQFPDAKINYAAGYSSTGKNDILSKEAIALASVSDIVLYIGGLNKNMSQDCEGDDRKDMSLPYGQDGLINEIVRVNKNVVVLNLSGNAVEMPWIDKIKGLMQVWYLGSEAGNAIADVLCGNIDPSGKLPFSFPIKLSDNAAGFYGTDAYPGDGKNVEYKEDILVGYRWHDTKKIPPLFPFGYGMSYTSFELKNATPDKNKYNAKESLNLSIDVTNTGKVSGAEVVQVYISKPKSDIQRALKELKGFKKVELTPMETRKIEISIKIRDFAYYNEEGKNWIVEPGIYQVLIGTSSRDIKIIKEIEVL